MERRRPKTSSRGRPASVSATARPSGLQTLVGRLRGTGCPLGHTGRILSAPTVDASAASTPAGGHGATSVERVCMVTPLQSGGIALSRRGEHFSAPPSLVLYAGGRKR